MAEFQIKERYDLRDFVDLIAYLRSERGCPWDREQTHKSIRRNVLEEAYEVCETTAATSARSSATCSCRSSSTPAWRKSRAAGI